jgi:hypothetical protein
MKPRLASRKSTWMVAGGTAIVVFGGRANQVEVEA